MFETLLSGFAPLDFMPHSVCLLKNPAVMALHVVSDGLIALAYFSIPLGLAMVAYSRKNLAYRGMAGLFAAFILACGITHLFDIWTLWHPDYVAQGLAKAMTAAISVITAVVLWPSLSRELTLPNSRQLAEVNEQLRQDIVMRRVMTQQLEDEVQARRQAEERLQNSRQQLKNVLDAAADGILTVDKWGRVELCNPAAARMFGYATTELTGLYLSQLMTSPDTVPGQAPNHGAEDPSRKEHALSGMYLSQLMMHADNSAEAGSAATGRRVEFLGLRQDGSRFPLDVSIGGNTVVLRDSTERKAQEQAIRDMNATLEQRVAERTAELAIASAAKSQFLANMSHEIRTPMNVILGLVQVLEKDEPKPEQRAILEKIVDAGGSLLHIINDILDLSKIEAGQLKLERQPFDLESAVNRIGNLLRDMAETKGLPLRVTLPDPPLAGLVVGDALRLRQVLTNFLSNAIKFTEQGHIELVVIPLGVTEATARLRFEVRDTGIGIHPEVLAKLFQPFVQADESDTRRYGGTGLGLAISKRLVELMGGAIGATSTPGAGSTFWCELPLARAEVPAPTPKAMATPATPAAKAPPKTGKPQRLAGLRVLVVDDNRMNQFLLERALKLEGGIPTLAGDGQQALDVLKADPQGIDTVLMDVQMPVMDGLAATRAIRQELGLHGLPVIAFSAGVLPHERQETIDAGADDFLAKPVDLERLVASLLGHTQSQAAEPAGEQPPEKDAARFPDIPGLNTEQAARLLGNDRLFFLHLLDLFTSEFGDVAERIRDDLAHGDRESAARRLHTLRGNAGNLGAQELLRNATALEEAIKAGLGNLDPAITELGAQLTDLLTAAAPWLSAARARNAPATAAPPLDPGQLDTLCTALSSRDLSALNLHADLEPAIAGVYGADTARAIAQAIKTLRFDEARALLKPETAPAATRRTTPDE